MRMVVIALAAVVLPAAFATAQEAETRISDAFVELGMAEAKASCYGTTIDGKLDRKGTEKAVSILQSAENSREVREGVMNAGFKMVDAFSAAHEQCGS